MNEHLEVLKAKRAPINSCADLSRSMRGRRYGILYFTEEFRIDFENKMFELNRIKELEMEIQVLENTKNSCPCIKTSGVSCDLKSFGSNDYVSKDRIKEYINSLSNKLKEYKINLGGKEYIDMSYLDQKKKELVNNIIVQIATLKELL